MTGSYSPRMALFSLGTIWKATLTVTWCLMTSKSYAHGRAIKMKRIKKEGMFNYYNVNGKVVAVGSCLHKHVYVNPGYYIATFNGIDYSHPILKQRFSSPQQAAIQAAKYSQGVTK